MAKPRSGKGQGRPGAPNGNQNAKKTNRGRQWMRDLVDDADRREAFKAALDAELKAHHTQGFIDVFRHGYGNPPQALDVNFGSPGDGDAPVQFIVKLATGDALPSGVTGLPESDAPVGGTD